MPHKDFPLFLGIDTGGTFTDSVLVDFNNDTKGEIVAQSKAPTTHRNLLSGIKKSLLGLGKYDFGRVKMVGLSTTLATNAIVEGMGRPAGLIVVGYGDEMNLSVGGIGTIITKRVKGGHDVKGKVAEPLDEKEIKSFVKSVLNDVEAFACASYFSVRNPEHEDRVSKIIASITDKPIVLGHMLSMDLNADTRATTAALNAGLIPLISELIDSVKGAITEMGIVAPLMAVKGDGSLMSEPTARRRPIETILSGPAASVVGARALVSPEHMKQCVVIDIGGTTSDIAVLGDGLPRLSDSGARVGTFRTFVSAVDVRTVGLGGDSFINYGDYSNPAEAVTLGPGRVFPVSRLAEDYPIIMEVLSSMTSMDLEIARTIRYMPTDFFAAGVLPPAPDEEISELYDALKKKPISPLSESDFGRGKRRFKTERLLEKMIRMGAAIRAGLTPTDIFNSVGMSKIGDVDASRLALNVAAMACGVSSEKLNKSVIDAIRERIVLEILSATIDGDNRDCDDSDFSDFGILSDAVRNWLYKSDNGGPVSIDINLGREIIAVGAPANIFIGPSAEILNVKHSVPENAGVANAVGAVSGVVMSTLKATIRFDEVEGYIVFMPTERRAFKNLKDARQHTKEVLKAIVTDEVIESGGIDVEVKEDWRDMYIGTGEAKIFVESVLTISAVGRPDIRRG